MSQIYQKQNIKSLNEIIKEIELKIIESRTKNPQDLDIKDLRRIFDQESAKMNQAIFNDEFDKIHEPCLNTIVALIEILSRT